MKIRNDTDVSIIIALRGLEGYDDREERLEPGQTSDDWLHFEDNIFDPEIIIIERPGKEV